MRFDYAKSKKIGRYEILDSDGGNGAYLSYIFKVDGGYSVGENIGVTVGNNEYAFRIAGFYNSVDTGTTNCNDIAVLLTDDEWDGLDTAGRVSYRIGVTLSNYLRNNIRSLGTLKSLGFVTRDIIYQTVVSFMPTCIVATVVGLWISRTGATVLLVSALNGIGIFSFGTPTRLVYLLAAGLAIILFTALYSVLLSGSVRHITPHRLFNNE